MKYKRILFLIVVLLFSFAFFFVLNTRHGTKQNITLYVDSGEGGLKIYNRLHRMKILNNKNIYLLSLKIAQQLYGVVKKGYYQFNFPLSCFDVTKKITKGDLKKIVIPEGSTVQDIVIKLEENMEIVDSKYLDNLYRKRGYLEGQLFPATYKLFSDNPADIIAKMKNTFSLRTKKFHLTREQIILASMVQAEGATPGEFKRIASVFYNRLKLGMKLESDPTLQYIVGKIRLTKEILKNNSKYNSYKYRGLPPTPICNPGIKAIFAVLHPEKTDYLFFVAKGDGTHYFSKTKAEHFRAVGYYQLNFENGFIPKKQ